MKTRTPSDEARRVARVLRLLASVVESLPPDDLDDLLRGRASLTFDRSGRAPTGSKHLGPPPGRLGLAASSKSSGAYKNCGLVKKASCCFPTHNSPAASLKR